MSSKKKAKPARALAVAAGRAGSLDPAELAGTALAAARYKDAIELFKDLLKRERRPAWLDGLAAAYAGRAEQLAAKDMVKEALALWRTRAESCQVPLLDGPYVGWLMKTGQIEHALRLLPSVDKLPATLREQATAQLAPAVLVAPDHLLAGLSPQMQGHRAAARTALAACCAQGGAQGGAQGSGAQGDPAALEAALQGISFRSPYRDLRPLLKGLTLLATEPIDPTAAAANLARVRVSGPCQALAQALRVCLMPGTEWLAGLRALDDAGRTLVFDLKGCPLPQRALVLDLMACSGGPGAAAPAELFDLLQRHRRVLPDNVARPLALRLLPHAPQRLNAFHAGFGPLLAADQERVLALAAELKLRPQDAEGHWLRLVKLLDQTQSQSQSPAGQRRAALVLRRLADEHAGHSPDGSLCVHALDWLQQSLQLDPTDRDTHLRLLRDARQAGELKQARIWFDAASHQFPGDALVLQEGVEIALAAGAYKKAAGLAKQVLQADPINPRVRTLVGQSHLAHARKLIGAHKLQAAQRELDEAAHWLRSAADRGQLALLRGFAAEPAETGDALLRQAVADLGGPLVGAFHLLLEAKRVKPSGFAPQELLRRAAVDTQVMPDAAEVLALAQALHATPQREPAVSVALGVLNGMLTRAAARLQLNETDHLLLCEALHRHGQTELARRFAAAALARWPGRPVFVYLEAAARFAAMPWTMPQAEWERLDRVFEQARDQGDERTASRLSKLLGAASGPGAFNVPMGPSSGAGAIGGALDRLLQPGYEDAILDFARREMGKATFDQLRREVNGSKKQFAQALIEMLKAAAGFDAGAASYEPSKIVPPRRQVHKAATAANQNQTDLFDD
jgi:cellulose synthase operon protein C